MDKDASAIRQEIEQTRERMADTVEALAHKADVPSRVKDSVQDRVDVLKGTIGYVMDNVKTAVAGATDDLKTSVAGTSDNVKTGVAAAADNVDEAWDQSARGTANAASRTRDKIGTMVRKVNSGLGDRLQDVDLARSAQRTVGAVQENPIGLALGALAIGFLTGSLLPTSNAERNRLKPIRDKIVDQAQAASIDLVEAGKAVVIETAQSAVATALSSAQSHGHDVVDAAKARAEQN